ncbi:alpha-amylase/4-alpha-glucanotransferase domain-containing protein [Treponema sp.]|uniref:alpha-amylase/4-alpha-glucanotransferase domain-containing protein n=1 Tax=Treponema sp. TaxID=166 RepID=UPI00388EE229
MSQLNVCLELAADISSGKDQSLLEENYQKIFKGALTFLYSHPDFYLSIAFTGPQLDYYERKHPESIQLLKDLLLRKQIEIIGGGYYAPIFPLIYPRDRSGQIEKMSISIRQTLGKRPCGLYLFGSIWDPMLITSFNSTEMSYVFLDSTLIAQKYLKCLPIITSEQGKSLKVLPTYKNLLPEEKESKKDWTKRLSRFYEKNRIEDCTRPVVSISIDFDYFGRLLSSGFLNDLFDFNLDSNFHEKAINYTLPHDYLCNAVDFLPVYIPAGMEWNIAQWASVPYTKTENSSHFPLSIHDYLNIYPQNNRLYERMMYISMLIFQAKGGDKMRKASATQSLWQAQSGTNFICYPEGVPAPAELRQAAYRNLNEAERFVRDASKQSKESLTTYDYNGDGLNEYIAFMERYNAVVSLKGGQITDFNPIKSSSNYAASISAIEKFDGFTDGYTRGFFVEHLSSKGDLKKYLDNNQISSPMFSKTLFTERKLEIKRKEIHLEGRGLFSELEIPVSLRKNITFTQSGINVQYILRNESEEELNGLFAVELNFAQTRFDKEYANGAQYSVEIIQNEELKQFDQKKKFSFNNGVAFIHITDTADKRVFEIEPNELAGFSCSYLSFKRPMKTPEPEETSRTLISSLFWEINIAPGMEKEKSIFLNIVPMKK